VVHLRDSKVLHLADEGNGPCAIMHDADQLKLQTVLGIAAGMVDEGHVEVLTDGHTFGVWRGSGAAVHLDGMLDQVVALTGAALTITKTRESVRPSDFVGDYSRAVADLGVGGANPNPTFTGFMALNQLAEIGLRPRSSGVDAPWARPALVDPAPVAGMPRGLALLPAAVAMLRWKLQKRDR
jgi:hypothetical protein